MNPSHRRKTCSNSPAPFGKPGGLPNPRGTFLSRSGRPGRALYFGLFWFTVPLVLTASHLMHGMLIGFHEASHGLLRKTRRLNEVDGIIIGVFGL